MRLSWVTSPRVLRQLAASHLAMAGATQRELMDVLGHKSAPQPAHALKFQVRTPSGLLLSNPPEQQDVRGGVVVPSLPNHRWKIMKRIEWVGLVIMGLLWAPLAAADLFSFSNEVQCRLGKNGTDLEAISSRVCATKIFGDGVATCTRWYSRTNNNSKSCAAAQSETNAWSIRKCFGDRELPASLDLGEVNTRTTSLLLGNGTLLHQWNFICEIDPIAGLFTQTEQDY
jgi:hypothetical protein